uniref:Uncharacterized protein n=1 Tax=Anopheles melas TaxID=34690 RepID=A0A182UFC0_9DIPT
MGNDSTRARTRSPVSTFASWPNCTSAPRNRRIFSSLAVSCWAAAAAAAAATAAADAGVMAGGGVRLPRLLPLPPPLTVPVGDELPWRLTCDEADRGGTSVL